MQEMLASRTLFETDVTNTTFLKKKDGDISSLDIPKDLEGCFDYFDRFTYHGVSIKTSFWCVDAVGQVAGLQGIVF